MRDPETAIVVTCDQHPGRPSRDAAGRIDCTRCHTAAVVNESNPRWAGAVYFPVRAWQDRTAFLAVNPPGRPGPSRWSWRAVRKILARSPRAS